MGLFQALETGKRALLTHQLNMSTIGQNIANVDTPGYSRQRAEKTSTDPLRTALGMLGSGVTISQVRQVRDLFLGNQFRQENKSLGRWDFKEKILSQVETMFNEPSGESLRSHMDAFFNSFSQLANAPESITNRNDVLSKAKTLVNDFRQIDGRLKALSSSIDRDLSIRIQEINQNAAEVASLNLQIVRIELDGTMANDLRDKRDLLIDGMSRVVDINTLEEPSGAVRVMIGAMSIVDGKESYEIDAVAQTVRGSIKNLLVFKGTNQVIKNLNGELRGLVELRDTTIPSMIKKLDDLAATFASQINSIHRAGFGLRTGSAFTAPTGNDFFSSSSLSAGTIEINLAVLNDVSLIAASQSGEPGDASNALLLSRLRDVKVLSSSGQTFNEFYGALIGGVGVETRDAQRFRSNAELVVQQISNAREAVQGVSLDEEMTELIRAQRAYEAAARVITTIDQALETVIRGMGIVGR